MISFAVIMVNVMVVSPAEQLLWLVAAAIAVLLPRVTSSG